MIKQISIALLLIAILNTGVYFHVFINNDDLYIRNTDEWPGDNWY